MTRAIIFDCFGVIVGKGFDHTYLSAGGDPQKDRRFIDDALKQTNLGVISEEEFNGLMAKRLGKTPTQWQEDLGEAEQADIELLSYIVSLRKKYKTAMLSNSNKGVLSQKIGDSWLAACFDQVVCSAEVGLIKPQTKIYKLTANQLGVEPSECVFIDDHASFVGAAEAIGMKGVIYKDLTSLKQDLSVILSRYSKA